MIEIKHKTLCRCGFYAEIVGRIYGDFFCCMGFEEHCRPNVT